MLAIFNGQTEHLIEVRASEGRMRLARTAAEAACKVLSINVPAIRFFYRGPYDRIAGYTFSNGEGIAIAADLDELETCKTAIHECRHQFQFVNWDEWADRSMEIRESDAILFELAWPRTQKDLAAWHAAGF
jgi:hypothetical protein